MNSRDIALGTLGTWKKGDTTVTAKPSRINGTIKVSTPVGGNRELTKVVSVEKWLQIYDNLRDSGYIKKSR